MNLIIIRHGETKEGKKGIILGSLPGTLSTQGKKEMKRMATLLTKEKIDVVLSSNLKRAEESAFIIGNKLKIPIIIKNILAERKAGLVEGKTEKEINWTKYEKLPLEKRKHQGGENFLEVRKRATRFLNFILKNKKYKSILIISHDVFIKMLLSLWFNQSIEKSLSLNLKRKIIKIDTNKKKKAELLPL